MMSTTDSLAGWLASRSDAQLVALLQARPDLAVPLPSSMTVLAARAEQRASVLRACEDLDTLEFAIIDLLACRAQSGDPEPLTRRALHAQWKGRAAKAAMDAALERLTGRALVWIDDDALRLVPAAAEALPWPLGAAVELSDALTEPEIEAALAELGAPERALLDKLATTGPRGRTKDAAPDAPADRPVPRLIALRLLDRIDEETVELPVTVAQMLRREPVTAPNVLTPPRTRPAKHSPVEVAAVAAGEVGELLRHCADILAALSRSPAPALRAGGLGVRELRRIAKQTGIEEERAALLVEVLAAAKLIEKGQPEPPPDTDSDSVDYWAPTPASDAWLDGPPARRWTVLAMVWLDLDRMPWMIGMRDSNDKPLAALSAELRLPYAPRDRRAVLGVLAEQPSGTALDAADLGRALAWRQPRRRRHFRQEAVENTLAEASALGLLGRGALAPAARALLHDTVTSAADAEAEMDAALPEPVDHVLVQADLTVIAPGPLVGELAQRMSLVADIESAGAATVYRIGENSVRRALDAGLTAAELHSLFATRSRTPVPQALTYLIDDVARRHGQLRAGMAQSFVRSDDPALLAQVLADPVAGLLALRAVAPTVAISQAPLGEVLEQLRGAGFAPAGEDSSGGIVDLRPRGARISTRPHARQAYRPMPPNTEQLALLVAELRAGERAAGARSGHAVRSDGTRTSTAATLALLQLAARARRPVNIGYVDAQGVALQRVVEPLRVGNGRLDALDPVTGAVRHFTLHRIASVALLE